MRNDWPIGTAKIVKWEADPEKIKALIRQGWKIVFTKNGYWGSNTLMEIEEEWLE